MAEMSLVLQKTLIPATGHPERPARIEAEQRLNIEVVFTSIGPTLTALKKAGELASRLAARITLVVPQVVPYPLPLETPPVLVEWNERKFRVIAEKNPVETKVEVYLCRDHAKTLRAVLKPHALVVLGTRKRGWWPAPEKRLARQLRRAGHEVIVTEMESKPNA